MRQQWRHQRQKRFNKKYLQRKHRSQCSPENIWSIYSIEVWEKKLYSSLKCPKIFLLWVDFLLLYTDLPMRLGVSWWMSRAWWQRDRDQCLINTQVRFSIPKYVTEVVWCYSHQQQRGQRLHEFIQSIRKSNCQCQQGRPLLPFYVFIIHSFIHSVSHSECYNIPQLLN